MFKKLVSQNSGDVTLEPNTTSRANDSVGGETTKRLVEREMSQLSGYSNK